MGMRNRLRVAWSLCLFAVTFVPASASADRDGLSYVPAYGVHSWPFTLGQGHLRTYAHNHLRYFRIVFGMHPSLSYAAGLPASEQEQFDLLVWNIVRSNSTVLPTLVSEGPPAASALAQWQQFCTALARRYGPHGAFWSSHRSLPYRPIRAWEIWNEPNSPAFFSPVSTDAYRLVLEYARAGLRAGDPNARIVLGGINWNSEGIDAPAFLRAVIESGGRSLFDAVAVHPYSESAEGAAERVRAIHRVLEDHHLGQVQIWITEIGWAVGPSRWRYTVANEHQQAQLLEQFVALMDQKRDEWNIGPIIWFNDHDVPGLVGVGWIEHCGLRRSDHLMRPTRARDAWRSIGRIARERRRVHLPIVRE